MVLGLSSLALLAGSGLTRANGRVAMSAAGLSSKSSRRLLVLVLGRDGLPACVMEATCQELMGSTTPWL